MGSKSREQPAIVVDRLMTAELVSRLNALLGFLRGNILGQEEVLSDIVSLLRRSFCGLRFPCRPIASMLFLGPTGVGKTETVNLFTQHLFGTAQEKLVRLDMSEYLMTDSIGVLRGHNQSERGLFGHYYDQSQHCGTLLFDEVEKAHPLIMDVFLQILSAGRFTVATGETLDLSNYIVVATSNVGSRVLMESRSTDRETLIRRTILAGTTDFRPETFARFDLQCVFNKLDYEALKQVRVMHSEKFLELIKSLWHDVKLEPGVVEYVQGEWYSEKFGARPMQNAVIRILG